MSDLTAHYSDGTLRERIFSGLQQAGITQPTFEDLAPFDEFHVRGLAASQDLVALAEFSAEDRLLDIGSGVGGPSRFLASETGAKVSGIDLTEDYCLLARELSELTGLSDRTDFAVGNALELPFEEASFTGVWIQHVNMNIGDKREMYRQAYRVLKPGGKLAVHEIVHRQGEVIYPVPWASEPQQSFLVTAEELRSHWEAVGFETLHFKDDSELAIDWFAAAAERNRNEGPPVLGLHLLFGARAKELFGNIRRNLEEGRVAVIMAVAQKPN